MTNEPRDKRYGTPLSEWIMEIPAELPVDAVGLWQFIPAAREDFDFDEDQLIDCVRRVLHALIDAGAKPVRSGKGTGHFWIEQTQYGTEPGEIVEKILNEWAGWGFGEPMAGGLWFALPELFG